MSTAAHPRPSASVVGGGPAGLMAAEVLRAAGFSVTVFDQMRSVGRKFLLAGRGGLNLTHSEPLDTFLDQYSCRRSKLEAAVQAFGPDDLREWASALHEPCFVGSSGRVFPESFRATPLLRAWLARLRNDGVRFATQHRWDGWGDDHSTLSFDTGDAAVDITSDTTIFALGGASWPRSGSDGGWVGQFAGAGIAVAPLRPANGGLCVNWTPHFAERFAGTPLKNVAISIDASSVRGDAMITTTGIEGGPIYAHSTAARTALDAGHCELRIDLWPDLSIERLDDRLQQRRRAKDSVSTWLRRVGFEPVSISLLREATKNSIPTSAKQVAALAKATPVVIGSTMPIDRAISSAGGVCFSEVDSSFMLEKMAGTFVVGEMLDWEAPTGGYLLQGCFSTGVAAASAAARWVETQ